MGLALEAAKIAAGANLTTGLASTAAGIGNASNSYGFSDGSSWEQSSSSSQGSSYGKTYGTEASAQDILRANEANDLQTAYMLAQMQYNSSEAEKARAYETAMSNTAYQRQVKDLIAAGLNPILAVGTSGASTPSVAAASGGLQSAHKANTYADSESYSSNSSSSSSSGGSSSHSENKSETQLKSALDQIASAAKGVMQGAVGQIQKNINNGADYSWGSSKY